MSSIVSSLTGGAGGAGGTGFAGPAQANIQTPSTVAQANQQYGNAQNALTQQQAFLQAVQAQNGLQNQNNVFGQLQGVANGTGPNPAQAQLAQATGANTANQAALMAGQRGASQNAGLIARQAAMQGGANQQNAAGQAASLQAQQSLGALNSMGAIAGQQAGQQAAATSAYTNATQGEQGQILSGIGAQNQAAVGSQGSVNAANTSLADTTMKGQQGVIGGITSGIGSALGLAQGGEVRKMYADPSDVVSTGDSAPVSGNATTGSVPQATAGSGPQSNVGKFFSNGKPNATQGVQPQMTGTQQAGNTLGKGIGAGLKALFGSSTPAAAPQVQSSANWNQQVMNAGHGELAEGTGIAGGPMDATSNIPDNSQVFAAARGGPVPALVSPGERYLSPDKAQAVAQGHANPIKDGKKIPGTPKVSGAKNSYANDTVPATLEEGGIVIPRSITQGKNPEKKAIAFVRGIMAKKGK